MLYGPMKPRGTLPIFFWTVTTSAKWACKSIILISNGSVQQKLQIFEIAKMQGSLLYISFKIVEEPELRLGFLIS